MSHWEGSIQIMDFWLICLHLHCWRTNSTHFSDLALLLSGSVSSVIRVGVCDVRLHPRFQRILYWIWCEQGRTGVSQASQRDNCRLWWGKPLSVSQTKNNLCKELGWLFQDCPKRTMLKSPGSVWRSVTYDDPVLLLQLLSKPKFSGVEKIKTIGSTYMAATGLNMTLGPECVQVGFTHTHLHCDDDNPGIFMWLDFKRGWFQKGTILHSLHCQNGQCVYNKFKTLLFERGRNKVAWWCSG